MSSLEAMLEAERRGLLPPDRVAALAEARRRGLIDGGEAPPSFSAEQVQARAKVQRELDQRSAAADEAGEVLEREEGISQFARPFLRGAVDLADGVLGLPRLLASAPVAGYNLLTGSDAPLPISQSVADVNPKSRQLLAPQNDSEQLASTITRGFGGVLSGLGVGGALAGGAAGAGSTAANVGRVLAANPGLQSAGAVTGGTAAEIARRRGAGQVGQALAGVAGGVSPSLAVAGGSALVRGGVRGGEAGRKVVEENLDAFARANTTPSVGQATERRLSRAAESLLSRVPGSAGKVTNKAAAQAEEIGEGIEATAGRLAGRSSAEQAGRKITSDIKGPGGFVERTKGAQERLYQNLDQQIPPATPSSVANTQDALRDLTKIDPGAARTTASLVNPKIKQIADDLAVDAQSGTVPYSAIKALRTRVGQLLDDGLVADVPQKQLRRLYGALSEDLGVAARQAGPSAEKAFNRANSYTRARAQRLDLLDDVVTRNGGPEAVFKAATAGTNEGATRLRAVLQSLDSDGQKVLSATVLRRLGRAMNSQQDDLGDKFSTETFLTNWNKLSPDAKRALFDRFGGSYTKNVDALAKVAANLREGSQVFKNTSGTGQAGAQLATASAGAAALGALFSGNPAPLVGVAATIGSANLSARLMTNADFVRWLAVSTKLPPSTYTSQINQLAQIGQKKDDPMLIEAAEFLKQQRTQKQGNPADSKSNDQQRP